MHATFGQIRLHSSGQLWSNPALRTRDAGLPAMLVNPSFLDLLDLALHMPIEAILQENTTLLENGDISQLRFKTTESMLSNIQKGLADAY